MKHINCEKKNFFYAYLITCLFSVAIVILFSGQVRAQGGDALFIDEKGNVGIGTDKPETRLEVNGELKVRKLKVSTGNINDSLYLDEKGNVGIGTDKPDANLEVKGTMKVFGEIVKYYETINNNNKNYQIINKWHKEATSDGFLVCILQIPKKPNGVFESIDINVVGQVGKDNRASASVSYRGGEAVTTNSFTMPVRKGENWQVLLYKHQGVGKCYIMCSWIPLGLK